MFLQIIQFHVTSTATYIQYIFSLPKNRSKYFQHVSFKKKVSSPRLIVFLNTPKIGLQKVQKCWEWTQVQ